MADGEVETPPQLSVGQRLVSLVLNGVATVVMLAVAVTVAVVVVLAAGVFLGRVLQAAGLVAS